MKIFWKHFIFPFSHLLIVSILFHQEFNGKGLWVLGSQFCTKKMKNIYEFLNSWNFWIFGSWTQPGAWHMIVPFWSWNLSDTTHVRSHTKFQLIWAINTAFTRGGLNQPPPSLKCVAGTPSLLGLTQFTRYTFQSWKRWLQKYKSINTLRMGN